MKYNPNFPLGSNYISQYSLYPYNDRSIFDIYSNYTKFSGKLTSGDKIQKVIVDTGRSISIIITIIQTFYNPKSNTRSISVIINRNFFQYLLNIHTQH